MPGLVARLGSLVFGRRLANREQTNRRIGAFEGLPAMGLDGLGSSAYGPEAALTVLIPLGAASLAWIGWVMTPIVILLFILFASYWQTISAYPNNGGAYIVARENLGTNLSLLAAASLMVDYVLNVAVGISAGVGALVSAVPALHPHILLLCMAILALITIVNLRGTLDAGRLFTADLSVRHDLCDHYWCGRIRGTDLGRPPSAGHCSTRITSGDYRGERVAVASSLCGRLHRHDRS